MGGRIGELEAECGRRNARQQRCQPWRGRRRRKRDGEIHGAPPSGIVHLGRSRFTRPPHRRLRRQRPAVLRHLPRRRTSPRQGPDVETGRPIPPRYTSGHPLRILQDLRRKRRADLFRSERTGRHTRLRKIRQRRGDRPRRFSVRKDELRGAHRIGRTDERNEERRGGIEGRGGEGVEKIDGVDIGRTRLHRTRRGERGAARSGEGEGEGGREIGRRGAGRGGRGRHIAEGGASSRIAAEGSGGRGIERRESRRGVESRIGVDGSQLRRKDGHLEIVGAGRSHGEGRHTHPRSGGSGRRIRRRRLVVVDVDGEGSARRLFRSGPGRHWRSPIGRRRSVHLQRTHARVQEGPRTDVLRLLLLVQDSRSQLVGADGRGRIGHRPGAGRRHSPGPVGIPPRFEFPRRHHHSLPRIEAARLGRRSIRGRGHAIRRWTSHVPVRAGSRRRIVRVGRRRTHGIASQGVTEGERIARFGNEEDGRAPPRYGGSEGTRRRASEGIDGETEGDGSDGDGDEGSTEKVGAETIGRAEGGGQEIRVEIGGEGTCIGGYTRSAQVGPVPKGGSSIVGRRPLRQEGRADRGRERPQRTAEGEGGGREERRRERRPRPAHRDEREASPQGGGYTRDMQEGFDEGERGQDRQVGEQDRGRRGEDAVETQEERIGDAHRSDEGGGGWGKNTVRW
mmetsp:Transcript_31021/g.93025  ORF Transcript_31021/g.93025 Transcript_31021/m.93025 type:complete len:678 (-) Transcript_31021:726-2759(-)